MSDHERPPICAPGEHDLVCHCGDDGDHGNHGEHGAVVMGCAACYRTLDELREQEA
jgi:hypothetical protein